MTSLPRALPGATAALTEPVWTGLGAAASSLTTLTHRLVTLSTGVATPEKDEDWRLLRPLQNVQLRIRQIFAGNTGGVISITLAEAEARRILDVIIAQERATESLAQGEETALLELGQVILGEVLWQLDQELSYEMPTLERSPETGFFTPTLDSTAYQTLFSLSVGDTAATVRLELHWPGMKGAHP